MLADVGEQIGIKRPVELFVNPLIASPMMLGFFRPYIILPTIDLKKTELAYIMRHELTHYRHLDMFYKWLVQLTVCLHWFNPFAYGVAKEINKCFLGLARDLLSDELLQLAEQLYENHDMQRFKVIRGELPTDALEVFLKRAYQDNNTEFVKALKGQILSKRIQELLLQ